MISLALESFDLFNIAGHSISGWMKSLKTDIASHIRHPFSSQLEERPLPGLKYHSQVRHHLHQRES